jgi:hypothetical protein
MRLNPGLLLLDVVVRIVYKYLNSLYAYIQTFLGGFLPEEFRLMQQISAFLLTPSPRRQEVFLFSRPAVRPNQTFVQWLPTAIFLGLNLRGHETEHVGCNSLSRVPRVASTETTPAFTFFP